MMLKECVGSWTGTNGFRLLPNDPLAEFPATATVTVAAGGHLTSVVYGWHQQAPMSLAGGQGADGIVELPAGQDLPAGPYPVMVMRVRRH